MDDKKKGIGGMDEAQKKLDATIKQLTELERVIGVLGYNDQAAMVLGMITQLNKNLNPVRAHLKDTLKKPQPVKNIGAGYKEQVQTEDIKIPVDAKPSTFNKAEKLAADKDMSIELMEEGKKGKGVVISRNKLIAILERKVNMQKKAGKNRRKK